MKKSRGGDETISEVPHGIFFAKKRSHPGVCERKSEEKERGSKKKKKKEMETNNKKN